MIGADGVDRAGGQSVPEQLLIALFAQRRRHDVLHAFNSFPLCVCLVQQQMWNHRFHKQLHAARFGS